MRLNHKQGAAAEDAALAFLLRKGCSLLARNWHCAYGEIDLIVKNGGNRGFGGAVYSISPSKLLKLQRSVEYYLQKHGLNHAPCRLDAVLIEGDGQPEWIQNITG